jgi:CotS family spore coat protein
MHEVKKHLYKNDFKNIDIFELSKAGLPYVEYDNEIYVVSNWIFGRECELSNPIDLKKSIRALAEFHRTMNGLNLDEKNVEVKSNLGKWPSEFQKKLAYLNRMKKEANKNKSDFDRLYMKNCSEYIYMAEIAQTLLKESPYEKLIKNAKYKNGFCHKDFTYHNIIIGENNKTYIIDFDYSCFELRIYDIASFIMRNMRKCNWDAEVADDILNEYNKVNPLTQDEYETIKALFIFPQKIWRIVNRYYNRKHVHLDLSLYNKFCEEIAQKDFKKRFLKDMKFI